MRILTLDTETIARRRTLAKRGTSNPRSRLATPSIVEYLGQNVAGKGEMTDLSGEGTKISGLHTTHIGMRVALQLSAPDAALLIQIPCTYVRWTKSQEFGVKFGPMEPTVTAQLRNLLSAIQSSVTT